jgi:tetratricopeptide (TPR) repeat protein
LGVHAAIRERDSTDDHPPYVPRDFDEALHAAVSSGVEGGCFVLLVGSSSVGKTRSAYEALLALVPDWSLVQPAEVADIGALAGAPAGNTVVWLDELQRYLDQQQPIADWIRTLRRAGAIVIGTLWPDEYLSRVMPAERGEKNPDRELLRMADVIDVAGALSGDEQRRATALGAEDSRIRTALAVSDAGFVQVLAAGPALVRWWEQSPSPYARAVIAAAADARRLGVRSALPRGFFDDAVAGYLTPAQRASAPQEWLSTALTYALTPLHGAAASLVPVPSERLGTVAGYLAADYLVQHARRARRTAVPPDSWWQAMAEHCQHPVDLRRLTSAARARARYECVELLHQRQADRGDTNAIAELAELFQRQGRMAEAICVARASVAANVPHAIRQLARLLVADGQPEEAVTLMWPPNDGTPWYYTKDLVALLCTLDRTEEAVEVLREGAAAGDSDCVDRLVSLYLSSDRNDEALAVLQHSANPPYRKWQLARLLETAGHVDEAIDTMKTCAETEFGAERLIDLLTRHGRVEDLRLLADQSDDQALHQLAGLLADQGRARELATLVDEHSHHPLAFGYRNWLADVLADQGAVDELRRRADAGDESASYRLAETLLGQNRVDEVRARAAAGDRCATWRLAQHLERLGRWDDAVAMWRSWPDAADAAQFLTRALLKQGRVDEAVEAAGADTDSRELTYLLDKYDRVDELRVRAERGDTFAALTLAKDLREDGRPDEALDVLTLAGDGSAAAYLRAELLREQGNIDESHALAHQGEEWAERELVDLLRERGLVAKLRTLANAGSRSAQFGLVHVLTEQGDLDGLREWADTGDSEAAKHVIDLLADRADTAGLRAEVDAGTEGALDKLLTVLVNDHHLAEFEAVRIRKMGYPAG